MWPHCLKLPTCPQITDHDSRKLIFTVCVPFHQKIHVSCMAGVNQSTPIRSFVAVVQSGSFAIYAFGITAARLLKERDNNSRSKQSHPHCLLLGCIVPRRIKWRRRRPPPMVTLAEQLTLVPNDPLAAAVRARDKTSGFLSHWRSERWDPFEITPQHSLKVRTRSKQKHKQCGRQQCANESHAAAIASVSADGRQLHVYLHLFWFSALKWHNTFILIGLQDFSTVLTLGNQSSFI